MNCSAWFDAQGLIRYSVTGEATGEVIEQTRGPLVAMGPSDEDFVRRATPRRESLAWQAALGDEHGRLQCLHVSLAGSLGGRGNIRCAHCGKRILAGDDLPDADTWDALFVEKESVAWMLAHFDCKRWLAKRLKGLQPFELSTNPAPTFDLSTLSLADTERQTHVAELD